MRSGPAEVWKDSIMAVRKKAKRAERRKDREWIEQKLAELKAEVAKLPVDRQEQLQRELEAESEKEQ